MSDFSDSLEAALLRLVEKTKDLKSTEENNSLDHTEGSKGLYGYYTDETMKLMRRFFRTNGGRTLPEDPDEILALLLPDYVALFKPLAFQALADGLQMGKGTSYAVKKFKTLNQLDDIFTSEGFRRDSELLTLTIADTDYDTNSHIEHFLSNGLMTASRMTGFTAVSQVMLGSSSDSATKLDDPTFQARGLIWDLLTMASFSSVLGIYGVGWEVGVKDREDEVLSGIMTASAEAPDGPE